MTVVAFVEMFAKLSPERISLVGHVGELIDARVTIEPKQKYPFTIVGVTALKGNNIQFNLEELQDSGNPRYTLTVKNTKPNPGRYIDTIYLKTNSPIRSEIPIFVFGDIRKKK